VTTSLRLPLRGPRGEPVDLARTLNSHGFADLAPSAFDARTSTLSVTVPVPGSRPRRIRIGPGRGTNARVEVLGPPPGPRVQAAALPGVGPYAAAHVMMTMGRNSRLILDSWTRPTYARLMGRKHVADATIVRRFRRYGPHAGLAFWLVLTRDWVQD
jgi:hypothetical protein